MYILFKIISKIDFLVYKYNSMDINLSQNHINNIIITNNNKKNEFQKIKKEDIKNKKLILRKDFEFKKQYFIKRYRLTQDEMYLKLYNNLDNKYIVID